MLAACASSPVQSPAPAQDKSPPTTAPVSPPPVAASPPVNTASPTPARWVVADWAELPGWSKDRAAEFWPAFVRSCNRPTVAWRSTCQLALASPPKEEAAIRQWLQQHLRPYRVEAANNNRSGLITGYFEPLIEASRQPQGAMRTPLHAPPADLATRRPYWTRQQLETVPAALASLRGKEIAYVADPLDVLLLQIQGSGRLRVTERSGEVKLVRLAFAGHNNQPYQSVGRWLLDQGELQPNQASWQGIKAWAQRNPKRINEMLWVNPRVVFFKEEAITDPQQGPRGAQGVALTPGRSIAIDPSVMPYGTPVWLDATEPLSSTPLQRLVVAQDTGSAIVGAVRADYFWGLGDEALAQAGRMKQGLRYWVLWPKLSATPRP
jgi:membrane-bound lytic murein transglycosylase A